MGSTIVEKILARASGQSVVSPGDIVVCKPGQVMTTDMGMATEGLWYRPKTFAHPERVAIIFDHAVPAPIVKNASAMKEGRLVAEKFGIKLFDLGNHGICHVVAAENGLARPGEIIVCGDSHTCASGALNCAGQGTGAADMHQAMTKGMLWYRCAPTVRYEFEGELRPGVTGKDVFFYIAQEYGGHSGLNMEFGGPDLHKMKMSDRRTIATMCAEVSVEFAVFEYDAVTEAFLDGKLDLPAYPTNPDADAEYEDVRRIDLGKLEPYIVKPDFVPNNAMPVADLNERVKIDQAFIGSCANGQIEDLRAAAQILDGRRVAPGVRLLITPGSQAIYVQAAREGLLEKLAAAGAVVTSTGCGACFGYHGGVLAAGEVCITASTRNFKGRMGSSQATIYMGSPSTVAASALAGYITGAAQLAGEMQ